MCSIRLQKEGVKPQTSIQEPCLCYMSAHRCLSAFTCVSFLTVHTGLTGLEWPGDPIRYLLQGVKALHDLFRDENNRELMQDHMLQH